MKRLKSRDRGFTLIELLIVTVVIVTLMGIVFRLAGVGGDSRAQSKTLARLQRVENALSGYYAAYGSYPPVPLQERSRNINSKVDGNGLQGRDLDSANLSDPDDKTKKQVEAACRAQPVAVLYPFYMLDYESSESTGRKNKSDVNQVIQALAQQRNAQYGVLRNIGGLDLDKTGWPDVNLFQFGLLSFLLPRYLFMLQGDPKLYDHTMNNSAKRIGQWAANNQLPCRIDTGERYESWESMQRYLYKEEGGVEAAMIANLASQAVCARWMPNFEGIISGGLEFYGVKTEDGDAPYLGMKVTDGSFGGGLRQFGRGGYDSTSELYILDGMTVLDGWGRELYYYSAPPYQSYRLWSAGPNGMTFPPWFDTDPLPNKAKENIAEWTGDDVSHLDK